jgi:hypothetical protein
MIAGLSEKKVITPANAHRPGRLYKGFMRGDRKNSTKLITPNSLKSSLKAPEAL